YSWGNGLLLGFTVGLFQASIVFMVRKLLAPNTKDTDLSEADLVASQAIAAAKTLGAKNAKEAAEMTAGRQITDEKWEKIKEGWEKNW
ncbi:MAG: hypothetical protein K9M17_07375, partial [Mariprofundaceae bacterium]|nr:hypothetical protein [Mariprofundaceae bacterium]